MFGSKPKRNENKLIWASIWGRCAFKCEGNLAERNENKLI
jgi:hypothetical protein